ncbi:hypothetical protein B0T16DRAFT_452146 [Cercophora newfieldiana]|uniref:VWFA domain-containing protein n=1 Tax=Cercophora newfieldiana TaxID=92897 RepID=A0AA39YQ17_9PEZI|nr:hypothetical protein B0T16DRAFT_452146 [Cercophora newfieldiana]
MAIGSGVVDKSHIRDALRVVILEISHEITHEDFTAKLAGDLENQEAGALLQVGRDGLLKWVRDSAAERYRLLLSSLRTRLGDAHIVLATPDHLPGEGLAQAEEKPARPATPVNGAPEESQGPAPTDFQHVQVPPRPVTPLVETPPQTPERVVKRPLVTTATGPPLSTPVPSAAPTETSSTADAEAKPTDHDRIPETKEAYIAFAQSFINKNLGRFFGPNDPYVQKVAAQAATVVNEIAHDFDIDRKFAPGLVKLALYDFVMLCDNSGSMNLENRLPALSDALRRIAKIANKLEPAGMSVRFLNHLRDHDGGFDGLKSDEDVAKMMARVRVGGPTRLGQTLRDKIVEPMIMQKAREGTLTKPVIVALITDGQVGMSMLSNRFFAISRTHDRVARHDSAMQRSPVLEPYGNAAVVFIVSRIGSDPQAEEFIRKLGADPQAGSMVFCCKDMLDEQMDVFQRVNDRRYTGWLMKLFLEALDTQTSTATGE